MKADRERRSAGALRARLGCAALAMAGALGASACSSGTAAAPSSTTVPVAGTSTTGQPSGSDRSGAPGPLVPPKTSPADDSQYLVDLAEADPTLGAYAQRYGNVALRALLTDGSAFCAFLARGGGIDSAIVSTAVGARSVESLTHLPPGVATFNAIEAVALLALCPGEQRLVPPSVQAKIRALGRALGGTSG